MLVRAVIQSVTVSILSYFLYITAPYVDVLQLSYPAGCSYVSSCLISIMATISTEFGSKQFWKVYSGKSIATQKNLSA